MSSSVQYFVYELVKPLIQLRFLGNTRFCPVCQSQLRIFKALSPTRLDAMCPVCRSQPRHRLIWLFFQRYTNLFDSNNKKMLHIAPEYCIQRRLTRIKNIDYLNADISKPSAMVKMDITDILYPDNTFDVIYCSHVLEHILDDRKAMRELYRVLTDKGWAVLQVPIINAKTTYEDPSITDPNARNKAFGHPDHVRCYGGEDYKQRLIDAGFNVKCIKPIEFVSQEEIQNMRINSKEDIFFCTKS